MIKNQPKEITVCSLEVLLMPNGEIISLGKSVGWFKEFKDYLYIKPKFTDYQKILNNLIILGLAIEEGDSQTITDRWLKAKEVIEKIKSN